MEPGSSGERRTSGTRDGAGVNEMDRNMGRNENRNDERKYPASSPAYSAHILHPSMTSPDHRLYGNTPSYKTLPPFERHYDSSSNFLASSSAAAANATASMYQSQQQDEQVPTSKKRSRTDSGSVVLGTSNNQTAVEGSGAKGGGHDGPVEGESEQAARDRKKRLALSCGNCQKRKIKCDRKQPCSSCIRRKMAQSCTWDDDAESSSFALNSDVRHLARRLAHLESLFEASALTGIQATPGSSGLGSMMHSRETPGSITSPVTLGTGDYTSPGGRTSRTTPPFGEKRGGLLDEYSHRVSSSSRKTDDRAEKSPRLVISRDMTEGDEPDGSSQSHSDTEDAAVNLEDVAFGARVPVLRAISAASQQASSSMRPRGPNAIRSFGGSLELTSALTSILVEPLSYDQDGRPRSAVRLGMDLAIGTQDLPAARSASMSQILAVLPGKEISDFLISKYFAEMNWDYRVLDPVAFPVEHDRYFEMLADGREDSIDPLWIAVFCMILALSLEGFWSRPTGARDLSLFRGLSERDLQELPSVWHDAALRALQIGEWGGTPRIRIIQCVVLFGQYIQISSSSGLQGRFLGWAASAIRVAQRMGLHRLGSNPETMPPDDPALPPGKNSFKREFCVRLFHTLVCMDSFLSDSSAFRCYLLHPSQYNTALPSNFSDSDLSRTEWKTVTPAPSHVHTDASFDIGQCAYATQIRRALDNLVLSSAPFSYTAVLDQDREFYKVLNDLPDVFSEDYPLPPTPIDGSSSSIVTTKIIYQRTVLHEGIYSRKLRLHRPFLSRGLLNKNSPFRFSAEQCIRSARKIILANYELLMITNSHWWMYTNTLGSAIVLFMDLFHVTDQDLPEADIDERKEVLLKAQVIFETQVISPALQAVIEQGRRILSGLSQAEEGRRMARAAQTLVSGSSKNGVAGVGTGTGTGSGSASGSGKSGGPLASVKTFAQVLKQISHELAMEEKQMYMSNLTGGTAAISGLQPPEPGLSNSSSTTYPPDSIGLTGAGPTTSSSIVGSYNNGGGAGDGGGSSYDFLSPISQQPLGMGSSGGASGSGHSNRTGSHNIPYPEYWASDFSQNGGLGMMNGTGIAQDFSSIFETLASEDWGTHIGVHYGGGGTGGGGGPASTEGVTPGSDTGASEHSVTLLGQIAATW